MCRFSCRVEVAHPLLVVTDLSFPILVGTDILRAHSATMSLGDVVPFRLNARVCDVCLEQRTELLREYLCAPFAVCTTDPVTIPPRTAALVQERVPPPEIQQSPSIAVEPLESAILKFECATLMAVCAPVDGVCRVAIVNPSSSSVVIKPESPIAPANSVVQPSNAVQTAATISRLPREEKLRKVLHELQIDALPDATPHKH